MLRACLVLWIGGALLVGCATGAKKEKVECTVQTKVDEESGRTYVWCVKGKDCDGKCYLLLSRNELPECHCKPASFDDDDGWREVPNPGEHHAHCKLEINRSTPHGGMYVRCKGQCSPTKRCTVWYKKPGPGEIEYGCDCIP